MLVVILDSLRLISVYKRLDPAIRDSVPFVNIADLYAFLFSKCYKALSIADVVAYGVGSFVVAQALGECLHVIAEKFHYFNFSIVQNVFEAISVVAVWMGEDQYDPLRV